MHRRDRNGVEGAVQSYTAVRWATIEPSECFIEGHCASDVFCNLHGVHVRTAQVGVGAIIFDQSVGNGRESRACGYSFVRDALQQWV